MLKRKKTGICNLVNFNLIVSRKRLIITSDSLAEIRQVKKFLEKYNPKDIFIIEKFGIELEVRPQADVTYKQFQPIKGYSLWQTLK